MKTLAVYENNKFADPRGECFKSLCQRDADKNYNHGKDVFVTDSNIRYPHFLDNLQKYKENCCYRAASEKLCV